MSVFFLCPVLSLSLSSSFFFFLDRVCVCFINSRECFRINKEFHCRIDDDSFTHTLTHVPTKYELRLWNDQEKKKKNTIQLKSQALKIHLRNWFERKSARIMTIPNKKRKVFCEWCGRECVWRELIAPNKIWTINDTQWARARETNKSRN